ncbi:hypothetical protein [Billgrantia bachuensis]|nr:hypothetical protein [Halomonas bachuensis]
MKLTPNQKRGAALGMVGVLGWFTGTFLPPELLVELLGGFGL